ncbi:MAG: MFS transporter [Candidatus Binatia bacterium]
MPSKSFRWTVLALISLSHIIAASAQYGINTFAPFYQHDLSLSRAQVGLFFTAFYLGMAGLSLFAGWLADRMGVCATILTGHLFLGICTMAAAMAPSFGWVFASFFFAGLGYSFLNPASTKGVMVWFPRYERATAMGIKQTGVPAGGVLIALIGAPLVLSIGWRSALAGFGAANLIFGLLFWPLWSEPETEQETRKPDPLPQRGQGALNYKSLLTLSCGTALLLVGQMSLLTYAPLFLKETLEFSPYQASQALAVIQIGAMSGRIGWGVMSDHIFRGRRKDVLVLIGGLSVALTFNLSILSPATSPTFLILLLFLAGFCLIGYQGVSYSLLGEMAGQAKTGTALGLMITINSVGTVLGTPLFGYVVDLTGSYPIAWRALSGTILLGTLVFALLVKESKQ